MLNSIWAILLFAGLLVAGLIGRISGGNSVIDAAMNGAEKAVMNIALPLAGMMMFWLGVLRLLEKARVLEAVVRFLSPLLKRLFPDVPAGHPALSAMVMNLSANMLGLSNNATPLGLKAMGHLQELNPHKQTATNAMVTFLALNTAAFTLIPMTAMNFLNAAGISNSYRVIFPTIIATAVSSVAAVFAAKTFQRLPTFKAEPDTAEAPAANNSAPAASGTIATTTTEAPLVKTTISSKARRWLTILTLLFVGVSVLELGPPMWRATVLEKSGLASVLDQSARRKADAIATLAQKKEEAKAVAATQTPEQVPAWRRIMDGASGLAIPAILLLTVGIAWARGIKVYEEFVDGAKEGFHVAVRIMPYLVAMLSVLAILRESGAFQLLEYALAPVLNALGFPVELLSLALMRPLSGSGSQGILNEILTRPDLSEMVKFTAAILYGSTETTFYVLTVYFGSVGVFKFRHAILVGLSADFVGMVSAVVFGRLLF